MPDGNENKPPRNPLMTKRVMLKDTKVPRATRRVRRGPPRIGQFVPKIAKEANKRFGFSEPHILNYWSDIVGERLARLASPEKLSRPNGREANSPGGILTIRVSGPLGLDIQHMEPQILERINAYYGFQAVSRLHIVRGPQSTERLPRSQRRRTQEAIPEIAIENEEANLDGIEHEGLRHALAKLGASIHNHKK
jgi:hypothetical protein